MTTDKPVAEIIKLNDEDDSKELSTTDQEDKSKSKLVKALEDHVVVSSWWWTLDDYLAHKLIKIAEEAMAPDNKGEEHIDYRTRLRSIETIIKLTDKNFNNSWVNINFFASPKTLKH